MHHTKRVPIENVDHEDLKISILDLYYPVNSQAILNRSLSPSASHELVLVSKSGFHIKALVFRPGSTEVRIFESIYLNDADLPGQNIIKISSTFVGNG